jgi:hypothetical protein
MDIQYVYTKKRSEFGRQVHFTDRPVEIIADIQPNPDLLQDYIARDPVDTGIQNVREFSEHWVKNFHIEIFLQSINFRLTQFDLKQKIGA